jgi:polyvinyl alcohol dehydrogenase (cytochrome)
MRPNRQRWVRLVGLLRRRFVLSFVVAVALAAQAVPGAYAGAAVPAWTTYRHDAARSGIDPDSTSPVTPSQAWQTPSLDGQVYAQPLVYGPYVYVATENDTVYELDAATGAVVWSRHLATPEDASVAPCGDISPSIGITSTPVIDPGTKRIYSVGSVSVSGTVRHELFALDLSSGQPVAGFPIMVDPPFPSGGSAVQQLQRPGLGLDGGRILIGYGGNSGDCNTYWGWLVSAPTDGTTGLSSFQVDAHYNDGAIWGGGNAPAVDAVGNVFVATGNGAGDSTSNPEYGDSVVKLSALASPLDWWAPPNWLALDASDADLGSSMPTLLPGGFLFQSGKDGNGYLLNGAGLGNVSSAVAEAGFCSGGSYGGSVYDPGNATIYAACTGGLAALSLGSSPPSLAAKAGFSAPGDAWGPPMIAGGLVWVTSHPTGTLYGLDLTSGAMKSSFPIPENGSNVNHFASPSAGGGRLFVASSNQVTAYTIAQPTPTLPPPVKPPPAARLSRVHVSSHRVSIAGLKVRGRCVKPTKQNKRHKYCQRPVKLKVTYTLSTAATVKLTLEHQVSGRKVNGRCVRQTNRNHKHAGCTRLVSVPGSIGLAGKAGANTFTFTGRIGGRKLGPGSYRLTATLTAGGHTAASQNVTFKIVG